MIIANPARLPMVMLAIAPGERELSLEGIGNGVGTWSGIEVTTVPVELGEMDGRMTFDEVVTEGMGIALAEVGVFCGKVGNAAGIVTTGGSVAKLLLGGVVL